MNTTPPTPVIPAHAGIHCVNLNQWIPAFAGMTGMGNTERTHTWQ